MRYILGSFLFAALAACTPSTPAPESTTTAAVQTRAAPPAPAPVQARPELSCDVLSEEAHAVVEAHNTCTTDADCTLTAAACPKGFACGVPARAEDVAQVNAQVAPLSELYKTHCDVCARDRVRCAKPSPVCSEGRCVHRPNDPSCDRLEQEAKALIHKHGSCDSDDDCVFARVSAYCLMAFVCGPIVSKADEQAFVALADQLSSAYYEQCGHCPAQDAHCRLATPICSDGHCSRKR